MLLEPQFGLGQQREIRAGFIRPRDDEFLQPHQRIADLPQIGQQFHRFENGFARA